LVFVFAGVWLQVRQFGFTIFMFVDGYRSCALAFWVLSHLSTTLIFTFYIADDDYS
jgi:hypothetical protein